MFATILRELILFRDLERPNYITYYLYVEIKAL
jgi:hypothetical protein